MSRGINKAIIVGNVSQDPEVKYTAGGSAVASLSVATSEAWKDKQSGEAQERTEWHRIVFWGRLAEVVGEYVKKGSKVYIEGKLQTRKWTDRQGVERYTTEIVAGEMQMLDGGTKQADQGAYEPQRNNQQQERPSNQAAQNYSQQPARPNQPQRPQPPPPQMDSFDDDIPF